MIPHLAEDQDFGGSCPYHGDCLEGMASGTAMQKRWGMAPHDIPQNHQAWQLEARYLALGLCNLILITMPRRVVLGGGVMLQAGLIDKVHQHVQERLHNYVNLTQVTHSPEDYIVLPKLGSSSGITGALRLAHGG